MDSKAHLPWPDRRRTRRIALAALLLLCAFLFAWFVWPTPWRYGRDADRHRVSRITGKAERYDRKKEEWKPVRGRNSGGTRRGGSPIGGGSDAEAEEGAEAGSGSAGRRRDPGETWWYKEDGRGSGAPSEGGSPIGGSRSGAGRKSESRGTKGGSPIGGGSPVGGGSAVEDRSRSPIGGD